MIPEIWTTAKYRNSDHTIVETCYEISNLMGIRDLRGHTVLPPNCRIGNQKRNKMYPSWSPGVDRRVRGLHQTVMFSFGSPPSSYTSMVDHINGDTGNWCLANLRWTNPCLNQLNQPGARLYEQYPPNKKRSYWEYRPRVRCCGREYKMDRTGDPVEATRQAQRLRTVIFNRVQPLFYAGSSLKEVRRQLEGWCPFRGVDVRECNYGIWKRPCPDSPPMRLSPFERAKGYVGVETSSPGDIPEDQPSTE